MQILLNKDYDLAYFLKAAESDIATNGAYFTVDMNDYNSSGGSFAPNNIYDVIKCVVPRISTAISVVYSATRS